MAEAPAAPKGGSPLGVLTRKLGPLPGWAWVGLVVVGFFLYRRLHPSAPGSSSTGSTGAAPTDQTTYVPGFDAATSGGGGIGSTGTPGNVYNYYYGDTAAGQAAGGGTAPAPPPHSALGLPPPGKHLDLTPAEIAALKAASSGGGRQGIPATSGAYNWAAFQTAGHGL